MSAALRITVHHSAQNYGPYSLDQVNSMLTAGRLSDQDLAWVEGTPDWTRLGNVPGVLRVPPVQVSDVRDPDESPRQILPAFLLAFFLGVFGVHRFYVGKTGSGIAMLVLTFTGIGLLITGIWAMVDWIMCACGAFTDAEGRRLTRWTT